MYSNACLFLYRWRTLFAARARGWLASIWWPLTRQQPRKSLWVALKHCGMHCCSGWRTHGRSAMQLTRTSERARVEGGGTCGLTQPAGIFDSV